MLSAGLGDPQRAREVLLAIDHPDWLTAPDALDAALTVAERGETHHRFIELRGNLAYQRGEWDEALRLYAEARDQHGEPTTARARKRAGLLYLRGRLDEADDVCAAVTLDGSDLAEEARVLAWRAVICWARGDADGCARFVEPSLDSARRSGDDGALAAAYTARAMLAALHGDLPANAHYYDVALVHAERSGDVAQIVRIRTNRGSRLNEQGLYSQAVAELDLAITTAELAGSDTFSSLAYNNRGEAYLALGQLDLALADLRRAHEIWTRLASNRIFYPLPTWGSCSYCAASAARPSPCSTKRSASPPMSATPRVSPRRTRGWPMLSIAMIPTPPPTRRSRRSRPTTPCGCPTPISLPARSPSTPTISRPPASGPPRPPHSLDSVTIARRWPKR